jgi:hypothetical protein
MVGINVSISPDEASVFSHLVDKDKLDENEREIVILLDTEARQRFCGHLDVLEINDWSGTAWLRRSVDGLGVALRVTFSANVVQSCVVTLEPVCNRVQHSFTNLYLPEERIDAAEDGEDGELVVDVEGDDFPEILRDDGVDIGVAVVEQFALILDPYPKGPGAVLERGADMDGAAEEESPFAVLKSWQSAK